MRTFLAVAAVALLLVNAANADFHHTIPSAATLPDLTPTAPPATPPTATAASPAGPAPLPNLVLNPTFDFDQLNEGAAITASGYIVDAWSLTLTSAATGVTAQRSTDAPTANSKSVLVTIGTGSATVNAADQIKIFSRMTGDQVTATGFGTAAAQTVSLCWKAKSSVAATFGAALGILPDSSRSYVTMNTLAAPNMWQKFCQVIPGDFSGAWNLLTSATAFRVAFTIEAGSNFQTTTPYAWIGTNAFATSAQTQLSQTTGATFQIAEVKLELSPAPTLFVRRDPTVEIGLLHRFFAKSYDIGTARGVFGTNPNFHGASQVQATNSTQVVGDVTLPTKMRCQPSITFYSPQTGTSGLAYDSVNAVDVAVAALNIGQASFSWQASPSTGSNANLAVHWSADCRL